jgi:hypothetical protein
LIRAEKSIMLKNTSDQAFHGSPGSALATIAVLRLCLQQWGKKQICLLGGPKGEVYVLVVGG